MKKTLTLLLALLMLVPSLASCSETTVEEKPADEGLAPAAVEEAETVETEPETTKVSDDLEDVKFDGRIYTVLYRDEAEHLREIDADELTGDIINDAIFTRTQEIEERFGMELARLPVSEGNLNNTFTNSVSAGDRSFDIAFQHMIMTASLAAGGVTMNWYDMPHLNFEKPWWTSSVKELTVNDIMYVTASDYCLNTFEMAWCLIFNKQMMENLGISTTPYDLVQENSWTLDAYYAMVQNVSNDSNGDGEMTDADTYGINSYGSPWLASISNYWWACGETISRFDDNGMPYFAMDSEKTQIVFEKMYALLVDDNISYWDQTQGKNMIFWQDQALFASMMIRDVEVNRDKDLGYGLVPYPKYDEQQEQYLNLVDGHASVMALPVTLSEEDRDFVGTMIEAFSAATFNDILPAYYNTAMQTKFAQDETMPLMLDLIREGRVFNFGYVYDTTINRDILVNLITSKSTELASKVASVKKPTEKYYERVTKTFGD
ncbi:MAG: hypothetical protein J6N32_06120 [Clostridia bacterium]|nr:hypothetical protein [Clostridia bacterium]MBP3293309.1 hypothetical protein [Clostridia bacterium]